MRLTYVLLGGVFDFILSKTNSKQVLLVAYYVGGIAGRASYVYIRSLILYQQLRFFSRFFLVEIVFLLQLSCVSSIILVER